MDTVEPESRPRWLQRPLMAWPWCLAHALQRLLLQHIVTHERPSQLSSELLSPPASACPLGGCPLAGRCRRGSLAGRSCRPHLMHLGGNSHSLPPPGSACLTSRRATCEREGARGNGGWCSQQRLGSQLADRCPRVRAMQLMAGRVTILLVQAAQTAGAPRLGAGGGSPPMMRTRPPAQLRNADLVFQLGAAVSLLETEQQCQPESRCAPQQPRPWTRLVLRVSRAAPPALSAGAPP